MTMATGSGFALACAACSMRHQVAAQNAGCADLLRPVEHRAVVADVAEAAFAVFVMTAALVMYGPRSVAKCLIVGTLARSKPSLCTTCVTAPSLTSRGASRHRLRAWYSAWMPAGRYAAEHATDTLAPRRTGW